MHLEIICLLALLAVIQAQYYYNPAVAPPTPPPAPSFAMQEARRPRFVLYNPFNGQEMEPLRYIAMRRGNKRGQPTNQVSGNVVELPQLWQPCSCSEYTCRCCLGLVFGFGEAFNQRICATIQYNRADVGLQLSIDLNQRSVANFGFSIRNPPDYCIPVLLPLPLFSCLRLYDIRAYGEGNVQVCISVVFKVIVNQFFEYRFNCLRFGSSGVFFVRDPMQQDQDQGQDAVHQESEQELVLDKRTKLPQISEQTTKRIYLPNDKLGAGNWY
ncbi:uncharacterized protein [Drosophila tropicalis]|uniref:uncharacterized protein n=1 Tax=Drosophila tropicalis TaxID=46794 RepID=UPI0035ABD087